VSSNFARRQVNDRNNDELKEEATMRDFAPESNGKGF
jgi:hypothetical protein